MPLSRGDPPRIDVACFGLDVDIQRILFVSPPDDHPGTDDFRMPLNLPRHLPAAPSIPDGRPGP